MSSRVEPFLQMLARGQDSALLRFSLGNEYLAMDDAATAVTHLQKCVELDPAYSAAWKMLGKALAASGDVEAAAHAYRSGIEAATENGDRQAAKEMGVFLKRLERTGPDTQA